MFSPLEYFNLVLNLSFSLFFSLVISKLGLDNTLRIKRVEKKKEKRYQGYFNEFKCFNELENSISNVSK